jgi:hypothetical protein
MPSKRLRLLPAAALLAACADSPTAPARVVPDAPSLQASEGRGVFERYVAIGTSLSMGWASDGVFIGTQTASWPAQLARLAHREITQPYIESPGCPAPIAPPIGLGVRLSGEPVFADKATLSCAPLVHGVTLPTQNVAITGARVIDALLATPENVGDAFRRRVYSRVLPPGATQVTAMIAQNPKLVSVELGANELFASQSGVALVGPAPLFPIPDPATFAMQYRQVLDHVDATHSKYVLLVGVPSNPLTVPGFRLGSEIGANAPAFLAVFNVAVQEDCNTTNAQNLLFLPSRLPPVIQAGLAARQAGQPPVPLTCAAAPLPQVVDFALTPAEQGIMSALAAAMNATIHAEALARGYAFMSLDALYAAPGVRLPLNAATLFTSPQPFGPFISLDGVHPNAAGQALIAQAAARALNQAYDFGIPTFLP